MYMVKRTLGLSALVALAGVGAFHPAQAQVSLKNGNFFMGYVDVVYPGGFEPKVERVYNSKTPYKGIFGWGWGSELEVYLSVSADGCAVVHEYGGGAENRFCPPALSQAELEKAVDLIADAAQKSGAVPGGASGVAGYKKALLSDATKRNDEWQRYRDRGVLKARVLTVGTKLISNRFSFQSLVKTNEGYTRTFDTGKVETYDGNGHLRRIADRNKNFIEVTPTKEGKIAKIVDNFNRKIFINYRNDGLVGSIEGENGKKGSYEYNSEGELVSSKDVDGNTYTYKYDSAKRHNLVEIGGYSDGTKMVIAYHPKNLFENVKTVTDRDGTTTDYSYEYDTKDKGHFTVGATVKGKAGRTLSTSKYEYFMRTKRDGEEWNYKLVTTIDGDRTETTYNECCGLPLSIRRGKEETTFDYDTKGRVRKKVTPTELTQLEYDDAAGKVSKVSRFPKAGQKGAASKPVWSEFKYDHSGNLEVAKNSDSKSVRLFYDGNGRIRSLVDQDKRRIDFEYDLQTSKPIKISDPQLGSITVTYSGSGEIKKVESAAGRKIALQVTSAFQNLLDIIRPAGVSLSF